MRLVSILGDSLSAFEGWTPRGFSIFFDKETQQKNGITSVYDMWWAKVLQAMKARLCVNNSYSGSRVSGKRFPAGVTNERLYYLRTEHYIPDCILIQLGDNDFGHGVPIAPERSSLFSKKDPAFFRDAYGMMLKSVKTIYPDAAVICGTLMRTRVKDHDEWVFPECFAGIPMEEYNEVIRKAARKNHCFLADTCRMGIRYETLDGSHPTADGHAVIADAWIRCLAAQGIINYE